jgi:Flp pilus assembly protein TadG
MMSLSKVKHNKENRSGAILPLVAILFPMLLLLSAVAINIAYIQLSRTELGISTDAAGRAAGKMYALTQDEGLALEAANEAGAKNFVAGNELKFSSADLEFGKSTRTDENSRFEFVTADPGDSNAVRILGNRSSASLSGPVQTFLPGILGTQDFELKSTAISTRIEADIVLVLDRSGSMAYSDSEPAVFPPIPASAPLGWDFGDPVPPNSRWLDAIAATDILLNSLNTSPGQEFISLVTYADSGRINTPLSNNTADVLTAMTSYSSAFEGGGTNIAGGLTAAAAELSSDSARKFSSKVIVVLTDGVVSVGPDPVEVARNLAREGILVIAVTFSNEADKTLMGRVAAAGNGFHRHAEVKEELRAVFTEISQTLPTLLTQ